MRFLLIFISLICACGNAVAEDLKGQALMDSLHRMMQPVRVLSYGGGTDKTWSGFYRTDWMEGDVVRDRYSDNVRYFSSNSQDVSGMNIEHIWANSWWGHVQNFAYKDLFNLYPSDATANQRKNNNPIGVVTESVSFENGVVKVGKGVDPGTGTVQTVWEPADQWKGDFARTYFYMATTYSNFGKSGLDLWTTAEGLRTVDPESPKVMREGVYRLMLEWSKNDPVDQIERDRCDSIEWIQGNRNPYVDVPGLCEYVWGDSTEFVFDMTRVLAFKNPDVHVDPNPDPSTTVKFSVTPASMVFTAMPGVASISAKASVYMQNTDAPQCTASAELPFQVSLDGEEWMQTITTSFATQGFYVRFAGAESVGDYEGEIICSAPGAEERVVTALCHVNDVSFWENFEVGSKGSYAAADAECNAAVWNMSNAMLGSDAEKDKPRDGRAVRMKGYVASGTTVTTPAHLMMVSDKECGCDSLWFWAGSYGTDTGVKIKVSYSIDGGNNWSPIVSELKLESDLRQYAYKVNATGKVRIKFESLVTGNKRAIIDDVMMSDHEATGIEEVDAQGERLGNGGSLRNGGSNGNAGSNGNGGNFDLSGREVVAGVRGVVIINGKKVIR